MPRSRVSFKVETNANVVRDNYSRFLTRIPRVERNLAGKIAKIFSQEIRRQLSENNMKFTGALMQSTRNVFQRGRGVVIDISRFSASGVDVAAWHEFAGVGHFVSPFKHPELMRWMQLKTSFNIPDVGSIFVTPTPFVRPAIQPAARRMRKAVPNDLEETLDDML